ncbi:MAG: hypothetical protein COA78_22225 [Blastopirellula sp.]|nr:MAG: hypothetical protein COA78_22225 [Blastopirellula sp.]
MNRPFINILTPIPVFIVLLLGCIFGLFASDSLAAEPKTNKAQFHPKQAEFDSKIQPLLQKYCDRCHNEKKAEGKMDMSLLKHAATFRTEGKSWKKVIEKLVDEEMPTEDPQPSTEERQLLIDWLNAATAIDYSKVKHAGHVTIPRLTREEYNNTMRDLLGVDLKPGKGFSPDGEGGSGFNNDRDALFISTNLMEKYFAAATEALDQLIAADDPVTLRMEAEKMFMTERNSPPTPWGYVLNRGQMSLYDTIEIPHNGMYQIKVRSWGNNGPQGGRLRIDDEIKGDFGVNTEPSEVIFNAYITAGTRQIVWNIEGSNAKLAPKLTKDMIEPSAKTEKQSKKSSASYGKLVNENSPKNKPQLTIENSSKAIQSQINKINSSWNSMQRPYEWIKAHTPQGNRSELIRFTSYIKDRVKPYNEAKLELAKLLETTPEAIHEMLREQNPDKVAANEQILAAVNETLNNEAKPASKDTKNADPNSFDYRAGGRGLAIDWFEISGPITPAGSSETPVVFFVEPRKGITENQAATQILQRFASRAFRRPVTSDELTGYMQLFQRGHQRGDSFKQSIKLALSAILVSPNFLFRVELGPLPEDEFELNDYQLASRLSYFLWMSMPDEELSELAAKNQLSKPKVLERQVVRMLKDPKAAAFTRQFASHWLGIGALGQTVGPDPKKFKEFTPELQEAALEETYLFFDTVVRDNRSLLELIDSKQTYLNRELAEFYGIKGVDSDELQLVDIQDPNRGGLLGMSSVLTSTSLPLRTSPVIRGKWVLETLLGEEVPPPDPNAGELPKNAADRKGQTLREVFELHRSAPQCAACHQAMDPIGFGLENFDAIGRFRTKQGGQPIDSVGVLPDGTKFEGPAELKQIILTRKDDFARNFSHRMLAFALGRQLQYYDTSVVDSLTADLIKNDYRPLPLIMATVKSYPFQTQHARSILEEVHE